MASVRKRAWTTSKGERRTAWTVDFSDAAGARSRRQFTTKREADAFRIEVEGQLRAGLYRPEALKATVADAARLYLEHAEGRMRRGERFTRHHLATVRGHIDRHILSPVHGVGALRLGALTASRVADFRDRIRDAGVSVVTARKVLATLSAVMAHAIRLDLLAANPVTGVRVIGRRDEGARKIVAPSREALRLLIELADPELRLMIAFAATTGLRASEQWALRWRHVDLAGAGVRVEARVDAYGAEDVPKSAAGVRTVPLGDPLVQQLRRWRMQARFSKDDDLVFPSRRGRHQDHANLIKRRFKPLFDKAVELYQVDPGAHPPAPEIFGWHALRHYGISSWIDAGLAPKTIQTFAGHSSLQVTMDRYGHLFPSEDHQRAMDRIAKNLV